MQGKSRIFLVDDDRDFREATKEFLDSEGLETQAFENGEHMLDSLDEQWAGVILCDVRMQGMDGFKVLELAQETMQKIPVVMMTGHGDVPMAIAAIKAGAYDFLEKPMHPEYLLSVLRRALNARKLVLENVKLRLRVERFNELRVQLIGTSKVMKHCRRQLHDVAALPLPVTLYGETGTGKELAARTIHEFSDIAGEFISINSATITDEELRDTLTTSEAKTGTLFIRSLHQLSVPLQNSLADFIRENTGMRIISSINGNPDTHLIEGKLSTDLYYLINVAMIEIPPLREREKDIFLLLELFMRNAAPRFGKRMSLLSPEQLQSFRKYDWPGNVRELRNVAEQIIIGLNVDLENRAQNQNHNQGITYDQAMYDFERSFLQQALLTCGGHKGQAANMLTIPRKRLYLRLKSVGLN